MATAGSFKPGHALNRKNALPRGRFITQHLIAYLQDVVDNPELKNLSGDARKDAEKKKERAKRVHWLVKKLFNMAMDGDMGAIKYIIDRIEGTAIQTVAFAPERSAEELAVEEARIAAKRDEIATMTPDQKNALYAQTLNALNQEGRAN